MKLTNLFRFVFSQKIPKKICSFKTYPLILRSVNQKTDILCIKAMGLSQSEM